MLFPNLCWPVYKRRITSILSSYWQWRPSIDATHLRLLHRHVISLLLMTMNLFATSLRHSIQLLRRTSWHPIARSIRSYFHRYLVIAYFSTFFNFGTSSWHLFLFSDTGSLPLSRTPIFLPHRCGIILVSNPTIEWMVFSPPPFYFTYFDHIQFRHVVLTSVLFSDAGSFVLTRTTIFFATASSATSDPPTTFRVHFHWPRRVHFHRSRHRRCRVHFHRSRFSSI